MRASKGATTPQPVGGTDASENSFAVFLNSNQSRPPTTKKSHVQIPFNGNIADADPHKVVQVSLTSMHFTNTIFNITEDNNKLEWIMYFAEGRGKAATYTRKEVVIPPGFYNITQMSDFLSTTGVLGYEIPQVRFLYTSDVSFCNCFVGFGAIPLDPNDSVITKAAPTNNSNTKIVLQSADLGHMTQFGTDLTTPVQNPDDLECSFIYNGVYLRWDNVQFLTLLKMLGYFNIDSIPAPLIKEDAYFAALEDRDQYRGYGISMRAEVFKKDPSTPAQENTTYYAVTRDDVEIQINNQQDASYLFSGLIYASPPGYILTCLYEESLSVPGTFILLEPGQFISGTGISIPSPYVVAQQLTLIDNATFTNGSAIVTFTGSAGVVSVGMAIANTTIGDLLPNADFVYSAATPNNYYYVAEILSPLSFRIQFVWPNADITYPSVTGISYVLTTSQAITTGGVPINMIASVRQITDIAGIITPRSVTNMSGVDEIHVHCEQLRTRNVSSVDFGPLCPSDVIAVVPVEVEFGFKQNYQPPNAIVTFLENTNIVNLEITLTDVFGRELNFNGVDWAITLYCQEVSKEEPNVLEASGTVNTVYQDQLQSLEGTAYMQERVRRKNGEITIYENDRRKNRRRY